MASPCCSICPQTARWSPSLLCCPCTQTPAAMRWSSKSSLRPCWLEIRAIKLLPKFTAKASCWGKQTAPRDWSGKLTVITISRSWWQRMLFPGQMTQWIHLVMVFCSQPCTPEPPKVPFALAFATQHPGFTAGMRQTLPGRSGGTDSYCLVEREALPLQVAIVSWCWLLPDFYHHHRQPCSGHFPTITFNASCIFSQEFVQVGTCTVNSVNF